MNIFNQYIKTLVSVYMYLGQSHSFSVSFDLRCIVIFWFSGKLSRLATRAYDENSPPEGVTVATKQPIGAVKHAWSIDSPPTPKVRTPIIHLMTLLLCKVCLLSQIVQPYRRTVGRLAPQGYVCDISTLCVPRYQLVSVFMCSIHDIVLCVSVFPCWT